MRRRSHSHRKKRGVSSLMNIGSLVTKIAPWIAFAQQLTAKDMQILPAGRSYGQQGKDFLNIITGRMAGFHLFNSASDYKPEFTFKPANILESHWVKGGVGAIAYGLIGTAINKKAGKQIVPKAALIGKLGGKIAFAGAIGATFDDPVSTSSPNNSGYVAPKAPSSNSMNYSVPTYSNTSYSSGYTGGIA